MAFFVFRKKINPGTCWIKFTISFRAKFTDVILSTSKWILFLWKNKNTTVEQKYFLNFKPLLFFAPRKLYSDYSWSRFVICIIYTWSLAYVCDGGKRPYFGCRSGGGCRKVFSILWFFFIRGNRSSTDLFFTFVATRRFMRCLFRNFPSQPLEAVKFSCPSGLSVFIIFLILPLNHRPSHASPTALK